MNRTYWFLFDGLSKTEYGNEVKKYSKADEEALVNARRNDLISEDVSFGELYDKKIMSTLVPLEEYVFEKWHYKRIITIGDSAHKVSPRHSILVTGLIHYFQIDPASGQGGNGAMEAAALLVNSIVEQLDSSPQGLSETQVEAALAKIHTLRYERSCDLVSEAHTLQKISSQRMPLASLYQYLVPYFGPTWFADVVVPICSAAPKIEGVPVPHRPHCVPFEDELPAKPVKGKLARRAPWTIACGLGISAYFMFGKNSLQEATGVSEVLKQWGTGGAVAQSVGLESAASLAISLIPTLSAWLVEGSRNRSALDPLSWFVPPS